MTQNPSGFYEINTARDIGSQGIHYNTADRDINTGLSSPKPKQDFSTTVSDTKSHSKWFACSMSSSLSQGKGASRGQAKGKVPPQALTKMYESH